MAQSYQHRLPREYITARNILTSVLIEKKSLNNELLGFMKSCGGSRKVNTGHIKRLVYATMEHQKELETMCEFLKTNYVEDGQYFDTIKASVLIAEKFWVRGYLPENSASNSLIKIINESYDDLKQLQNAEFTSFKSGSTHPRYIRINLLKTTEKYVLNILEEEGFVQMTTASTYSEFLKQVQTLEYPYFIKDIHFPELLLFPSDTQFHTHTLYQNNLIILQSKSSCFPVKLLNPKPGSIVLDMCAAPGMKTCLLAAHMDNQGLIYAVERDPSRYETLQQILHDKGVTCAKTFNQDALDLIYTDFPDVTHILVDPSCSGTGMDRLEMQKPKSDFQIEQLSQFQFRALVKAMWFPSVRRIVYSTCSILPVENEAVVAAAIKFTNNNFKVVDAWPESGANFQKGSSEYEGGDLCMYLTREKDYTTGFFVAVIERVSKKNKKSKVVELVDHEDFDENSYDEDSVPSKKRKMVDDDLQVKKSKKEKIVHGISSNDEISEAITDGKIKKKKSKKSVNKEEDEISSQEIENLNDTVEIKKKKKSKLIEEDQVNEEISNHTKKKKKSKKEIDENFDEIENNEILDDTVQIKKKKKSKTKSIEVEIEKDSTDETENAKKIKKSKKEINKEEPLDENNEILDDTVQIKKKKKSKTKLNDNEVEHDEDIPENVKKIKKSKKTETEIQNGTVSDVKKKKKSAKNEIHDVEIEIKKKKSENDEIEKSKMTNDETRKKKKKKHENSELLNNEEIMPAEKSKKKKKAKKQLNFDE